MSKRTKKIVLVTSFLLLFFFSVSLVFAAELENPLGDTNKDPRVIIGNVIQAVLGIVGSLALATFILGGVFWLTSAGNEDKIKKGKDMIIWASFGLAVVFFSYALVSFVLGALSGTGTNSVNIYEAQENERSSN